MLFVVQQLIERKADLAVASMVRRNLIMFLGCDIKVKNIEIEFVPYIFMIAISSLYYF